MTIRKVLLENKRILAMDGALTFFQHRVGLRRVHGKFNCITVNFDKISHVHYLMCYNAMDVIILSLSIDLSSIGHTGCPSSPQ